MRLDNPLPTIADAIYAAVHRDLPDIKYKDRDWEAYRKNKTDVYVEKIRRPSVDDIRIKVFPQLWGSGSLGYGGMGTASMTEAYTVIVSDNNALC